MVTHLVAIRIKVFSRASTSGSCPLGRTAWTPPPTSFQTSAFFQVSLHISKTVPRRDNAHSMILAACRSASTGSFKVVNKLLRWKPLCISALPITVQLYARKLSNKILHTTLENYVHNFKSAVGNCRFQLRHSLYSDWARFGYLTMNLPQSSALRAGLN